MSPAKALKQLLEQIAETAYEASGYASQLSFEEEAASAVGNDSSICVPTMLPASTVLDAVEYAIRARPDNAPTVEQLQDFADGLGRVTPTQYSLATSRFWGRDRRELTVSFIGEISSRMRARILHHMNSWSEASSIRFVFAKDEGEVRVSQEKSGNWSFVGTDIGLVPIHRATTNFEGLNDRTSEEHLRRVVQHQAGHILGLEHSPISPKQAEQLDYKKTCRYLRHVLGWTRQHCDRRVMPKTQNGSQAISNDEANPESIMTWQFQSAVTTDGKPIVGASSITEPDFALVESIYPA